MREKTEKAIVKETTLSRQKESVEFTEDFKWDRRIIFSADSFTRWTHSVIPEMKTMPIITHNKAKSQGIRIGKWVFYNRELPICATQARYQFDFKGAFIPTYLQIYKGMQKGEIGFDDTVGIPVLANSCLEPWMSLTPNEVLTQRGQVKRARGNVGMAGLGMGWAARRVLERKQVKHLTVYDNHPEVLEFFGEMITRDFGDRVTLVEEDAYEVDWLRHDVALWDIWDGLDDKAYDNRFDMVVRQMKEAGKACVGWGIGTRRYA